MRLIATVVVLVLTFTLCEAQSRIRQSINTGWSFFKGEFAIGQHAGEGWSQVSLPHSFNAGDVADDEPGYYRGNAWYRKTLFIPTEWKSRSLYLHFEGANQVATVYVNGTLAYEHIGGYTAFRVPLNKFLRNDSGSDEILVRINNAYNPDIPPLTADFTFFGGIYRDVYLESVNEVHFKMDEVASDGVYVTTPFVSQEKATLRITGSAVNLSTKKRKIKVITKLLSSERKLVASQEKISTALPGGDIIFELNHQVNNPELWSPGEPNLYIAATLLVDADTNEILDEISHPVGFRWFSFTANEGFYLNGKPLKIWGTSRHQDFPMLGNALPDEIHVTDVKLLKEMGGNFLRVAHYPQDPAILEECDRLGIIASVEIPVVNAITESVAFAKNSEAMLIEMIKQNFNHPSVIMWACMNEVLLRPPFNDDRPRQEIYFKNVTALAKKLDSLIRKSDPSRVTMAAFHGNYGLYKRTGLIDIPMVAGWNLYQGWYSDNINGFATFLDEFHKDFPDKPILVTEYGADGDPRVRSFNPVRFDKSVEYETYYHQIYYRAMVERPFVSGGLIWNLCDFSSETRAESMPHVNNKGIVDLDRKPKDCYYLYQSYLSEKPFLKIGSGSWTKRSGEAKSKDSLWCEQKVDVYTNTTASIKLLNNGKLIAEASPTDGIASFNVKFKNGVNCIEAVASAEGLKDFTSINFRLQPFDLTSSTLPFESINISLGDQRFIIEEKTGVVWVPEKPYAKGSWGYVGGRPFILENKRQPFGSDKNILNTDNDPVYETQRIGLDEFRLDVPDGNYEISFHFAELTGGTKKEALAYNLAGTESTEAKSEGSRSFDVVVNEKQVASSLGNDNYLVPENAYSFKTTATVLNGQGISIKFKTKRGESILNGLQVRKIY